jgi:hypothetical protein
MKQLLLVILVFTLSFSYATDFPFTVNGKNYKIITTQKSWQDAAAWAVQDGGYLVHINSQQEQDSIYAAIQSSGISTTYTVVNDGGGIAYIWIGATDKNTEGTWIWDGNNDASGDNFYTGQGNNGTGSGAAVSNAYNNWGGKSSSGGSSTNEPDDFLSNQDGGAIALDGWPGGSGALGLAGEWNDIDITNTLYFIVEYETVGLPSTQNLDVVIRSYQNECVIVSTELLSVIQVFNAAGQCVVSENINGKRFSWTAAHAGIYFIRIQSEQAVIRQQKVLIL